jgi:transposase
MFELLVVKNRLMFLKRTFQKNKDGSRREYLQLVESRRINGKPRHVVLLTLGRSDSNEVIDKIDQIIQTLAESGRRLALLDLDKDLKADWSKPYGIYLVFRRLWEESELSIIFENELATIEAQFDVKGAIFNMILNRLSDPCSKRGLLLWQEETYGVDSFDLQHYYRALDYLIERKEGIEESVFGRMRDLFCQDVDVVLFDTTSLVYYGEGEPEESSGDGDDKKQPLLARGFSKDHRSDLKQIVVGVMMSKDGVPLAHEVFSGNTNDVSCFTQVIDQLAGKYKIGKVILVGDRGMISQKNIDYLNKRGYQYILGYRMRTIPKHDRYTILSKADLKKIRKDLQWKEVRYNDQRLLVCYNPERAKLDAAKREEILERITAKIKDGSILSIVDNANYKKFLKIEGKKPKLDPEQVERDEWYDGVYVLTTNTKLKGQQIIDSYKDLWQVEHAFRALKTELEAGPIYHWKEERIRAHVMICFLALVLRTIFYKKLKAHDKEASYTDVISDLQAMHAIGLRVKENQMILRTEIKPKAMIAFHALKMVAPKRILFSDNPSKSVVIRPH